MRTSTTSTPDARRQRQWLPSPDAFRLGVSGFTLLEISLVLLIMAVVLALVVPRLRDPGQTELLAQSRRLITVFRLLRSEAILNGTAYRLNYDLDNDRYWVDEAEPSGDLGSFTRSLGPLAQDKNLASLKNPVFITDVFQPTLGKIANGQLYTIFYPDGSIDLTVIHLGNGRDAFTTLWVDKRRLNMAQGYSDVDYGS